MENKKLKIAQVVYTPATYAKLEKVASDLDINISALSKAMIVVGLQHTYGINLSDVDVDVDGAKPKPKAKKSPTVQ